jgi:hypothetical protein
VILRSDDGVLGGIGVHSFPEPLEPWQRTRRPSAVALVKDELWRMFLDCETSQRIRWRITDAGGGYGVLAGPPKAVRL